MKKLNRVFTIAAAAVTASNGLTGACFATTSTNVQYGDDVISYCDEITNNTEITNKDNLVTSGKKNTTTSLVTPIWPGHTTNGLYVFGDTSKTILDEINFKNNNNTKSLTLCADFKNATYNINYHNVTEAEAATLAPTYTYGTGLTLGTLIDRETETFAGWYDNEDLEGDTITTIATTAMGDKDFYAAWEKKAVSHTITYEVGAGKNNAGNPATFTEGEVVTLLDAEAPKGYEFDAWYTTSTFDKGTKISEIPATATADVTVYAHYELETYKIEYQELEGADNSANPTTYDYEHDIILTAPVRKGYTFDYWCIANGNSGKCRDNVEGDTIAKGTQTGKLRLIAHWLKNYTITFDADNGDEPTTATYTTKTGSIELPEVSREGYRLDGWSISAVAEDGTAVLDSAFTGDLTDLTGDFTVKAEWTFNAVLLAESDTIVAGSELCNFAFAHDLKEDFTITFDGKIIEETNLVREPLDDDKEIVTFAPTFVSSLVAGIYTFIINQTEGTLNVAAAAPEEPDYTYTLEVTEPEVEEEPEVKAPKTGYMTAESASAVSSLSLEVLVMTTFVILALGLATKSKRN